MSEPFVGEIRLMPYMFTPEYWLPCDGQLVDISGYSMLFAVIGNIYGGNGYTNFALPNLQGRAPLGLGNGPGLSYHTIGEQGGYNAIVLYESNMPTHKHTLQVTRKTLPEFPDPRSNSMVHRLVNNEETAVYNIYKNEPDEANYIPMATGSLQQSEAGEAHENRQPYIAMNYFIAYDGIYPSRS